MGKVSVRWERNPQDNALQMVLLFRVVGKNTLKCHTHQKAHTTPVGDMCVHYESDSPSGFREQLWKRIDSLSYFG